MYRTVMLRFNNSPVRTGWPGVLKGGLTREEAQEICRDPQTSSSTCTDHKILKRWGLHTVSPWFVAFEGEE